MLYPLTRSLMFAIDAEKSHNIALKGMNLAAVLGMPKLLGAEKHYAPVEVMGIKFPNPVGLAAGLDKNGASIDGLSSMGFGFIEVGTVTPKAQVGNPKPRIFRIPEHNAIINRMGFNNDGVDALLKNIDKARFNGVLGINIGKNKDTPNDKANDDYLYCLRKVYSRASYITLNLSSPNTPGLRTLQFGESLNSLLEVLKNEQAKQAILHDKYVPIAVKIAPDLSADELIQSCDSLKKHKIDVFFSPDGFLCLNTEVKQIPVIHDLSFIYYPKDIPFFNRKYVNYFYPKFAKKASKIVTVSDYSKKDIEKNFDVSPEDVLVAHNGIGEVFHPIPELNKENIRRKFTEGKDYFLFVSALHPRKNIVNLFQAFDLFKKEAKSELKLLMVGEKYWWNSEIKNCFENLEFKRDIVFTGHIQSSELNEVYGAGFALTYVSYFEGFGIPLVEAMKCELPIIASNATSLPEVGGEAAIYVNPFSIEDIKNGMKRVFSDESLRLELIENGKQRAKQFSWDKTANTVWQTIVEVYENH